MTAGILPSGGGALTGMRWGDTRLTGPRREPPARWESGHDEDGSVSVLAVFMVLVVAALAGLVLDAGLAVATKVQAISSAQSAARAGARELDVPALRANGVIRIDPDRARASAQDWLRREGHDGAHATVTLSTTPTGQDAVTVHISAQHRTQLLGVIGVRTIAVAATETAIAVQP